MSLKLCCTLHSVVGQKKSLSDKYDTSDFLKNTNALQETLQPDCYIHYPKFLREPKSNRTLLKSRI